jgi:hypothetical protein
VAALGRKVGIIGFVFSVGLACTQLFGDRQNTIATPTPGQTPTVGTTPLQPVGMAGPAEICATGQMRCEGALLQTCADDRTSWVTVQRCGAAALCQTNPAACLAATCSADEMTCAGAVLQKCNAERTGWDLFDTCLSPAHCNADLRQCMPEACNPGDRRCDRSDGDQSPVLEACRDDRSDWAPLDACATRELCDQTLTSTNPGGLVLGSDGMVQVQAPTTPETALKCNLPACAVGEVRCEGTRLEYCSEGRTGWISAEECASEALCTGSLNNVTAAGLPACLPPACAAGTHRCTDTGVLQVCSEDRTGFRDQEQCIGAPFCNAVLADQGQAGCRDAPCEAGQMQCNGAQIQVCREDRTGLDDAGAPCESAALCNADDPANAFCEPPVCHRGATAGDEFHCEGAQLQRCNESLSLYDTIQTCVTAALCDASQRQNGCKTPACQPGQHACKGGFLQTCNADQTAFDNTENCGSQAQCDANAGRCADPCEPGTNRCNNPTGDLETCRDRLTGWQPIADCPNVALCDLANNRCDICLGGQFSCADNQLRQCSADGGTFSRQNIPPECAALPNNQGVGIRGCQNNQVVVNPCQFGCTNGRCHECNPGDTQCVGNGQIRRCGDDGFYGAPTSCSNGNACDGVETCQNNQCVRGQAPNCNDGNPCTNDTCNPTAGCQFPPVANRTTCDPPSGTLETCSNGNRQVTACGTLGCAPGSTVCNNCNASVCNGNQFTPCNGGRFGATVTCNDTDGNVCTGVACDPQRGCVTTPLSGISCSDGNACNGNETCQNGACSNPPDVACPNLGECRTNTCNPQTGACVAGNANGGRCANNTGTCQGGACVPDAECSATRACPNGEFCVNGNCVACRNAGDCNDSNACTTDACSNGNCSHAAIAGCSACVGSGALCGGTILIRCVNGVSQNVDCDDNDPSTTDGCSVRTDPNGVCTHTPAQVCVPSSSNCDGNTLIQCNSTGTQATRTACRVNCVQTATNVATCFQQALPPPPG